MKRKTISQTLLGFVLVLSILFASAIIAKPVDVKAASPKYYIKVNTQKCVTTVYIRKNGKWKPYRCMYCAVGKKSTPSPKGTFSLSDRWSWLHMVGADYDVQVRYAIQVHGNYFLHSCCYKSTKKNTEIRSNFNGLGKGQTHGCVRFSVMDAKWLYENCSRGTKVKFYKSKNPGPLGKPQVKLRSRGKSGWDPTDPDKKNPNFKMKGPTINISKKKPSKIEYGSTNKNTKLMYGVTAINRYANQDLTSKLKIDKVTLNGKEIKTTNFSTKNLGEYQVTYYCRDKYCTQVGKKGTYETYTFIVYDKTTLTVNNKNRTASVGQTNAVDGVSAKALSKDMTDSINVQIVTPSGTSETLNYKAAQGYKFGETGNYQITYTVVNPYPEETVTDTAVVTVK